MNSSLAIASFPQQISVPSRNIIVSDELPRALPSWQEVVAQVAPGTMAPFVITQRARVPYRINDVPIACFPNAIPIDSSLLSALDQALPIGSAKKREISHYVHHDMRFKLTTMAAALGRTLVNRERNLWRIFSVNAALGRPITRIEKIRAEHIVHVVAVMHAAGCVPGSFQNFFSTIKHAFISAGRERDWEAFKEKFKEIFGCWPSSGRIQFATYDHSLSVHGITLSDILREIGKDFAWTTDVLRIQSAAGLRIRESTNMTADNWKGTYVDVTVEMEPKNLRPRRAYVLLPGDLDVAEEAIFNIQQRGWGGSVRPPGMTADEAIECVRNQFEQAVKKLGIPQMSPHDLRHDWVGRALAHLGTRNPVAGTNSSLELADERDAFELALLNLGHQAIYKVQAYCGALPKEVTMKFPSTRQSAADHNGRQQALIQKFI